MINDDGEVKEKLTLSEVDPIFAMPFRQMITESFAEGKHFFVAKILTKNMKESPGETPPPEIEADGINHSHFYNVYGILKLLFKKRGEQFVGRFHDTYPITVKNPITNSVSAKFC